MVTEMLSQLGGKNPFRVRAPHLDHLNVPHFFHPSAPPWIRPAYLRAGGRRAARWRRPPWRRRGTRARARPPKTPAAGCRGGVGRTQRSRLQTPPGSSHRQSYFLPGILLPSPGNYLSARSDRITFVTLRITLKNATDWQTDLTSWRDRFARRRRRRAHAMTRARVERAAAAPTAWTVSTEANLESNTGRWWIPTEYSVDLLLVCDIMRLENC